MVVQNEEPIGLARHGFENVAGITEIDDDHAFAFQPYRWRRTMFHRNETGLREATPQRPGGAETICTFRVVEHHGGRMREILSGTRAGH